MQRVSIKMPASIPSSHDAWYGVKNFSGMGCGSSSAQGLPSGLTKVEGHANQRGTPAIQGSNVGNIQVPDSVKEKQYPPEDIAASEEVNQVKQTVSVMEDEPMPIHINMSVHDGEIQEPEPVDSQEPEEEADEEEKEDKDEEVTEDEEEAEDVPVVKDEEVVIG